MHVTLLVSVPLSAFVQDSYARNWNALFYEVDSLSRRPRGYLRDFKGEVAGLRLIEIVILLGYVYSILVGLPSSKG